MKVFRFYDKVKADKDAYLRIGDSWIDIPDVTKENIETFGWKDVNRVLLFHKGKKIRFVVNDGDEFHISWFLHFYAQPLEDVAPYILEHLSDTGRADFLKAIYQYRTELLEDIKKQDEIKERLSEEYDRLSITIQVK